ncbi:MAG: hypothetical protein HOH13_08380 [Crocinitomicaceae bacterium]|nr:hypothetical protein [Crocinitomicaceae bacterium]
MNRERLTNIAEMNESFLSDGFFIVLFHANRIPPHLGLVANRKYFSLTAKETQVDIDINPIWRVIRSKSIETIFIKVDYDPNLENLTMIFENYDNVLGREFTCLLPIKDFFERECRMNVEGVNFVFDLIKKLKEKELILQTFHLNLDDHIDEGSFQLQEYTLDDIYTRISDIQRTC